ncbi:RICIN domain-containing protein [Dactylosporangium sp. NPDC051541]|uniref:RICIN domain-containing protein n=1 Tax=Dactylosporangium sp. NPDC051541 TaxID=3363977 RepID=UPI0037947DB6
MPGCLGARHRQRHPGHHLGLQWWSDQQWNVNANGTITGVESGLCLDVTGAATASGTLAQLWACNNGGNQQWRLG